MTPPHYYTAPLPGPLPARHARLMETAMSDLRSFHGLNAGYVLELYERYQQDPASVDAGWREFFGSFSAMDPGATPAVGGEAGAPIDTILSAHRLAQAIRARGHTSSRLDPLG